MPAGPLRDGASEPARRRMRRLGVTEVRLAPCGAVRSLRTQQRAWAFSSTAHPFLPLESSCTRRGGSTIRPTGQCSTLELHHGMNIRAWVWTGWEWLPAGQVLLRKEVIQPHLPVRLPCYDFVPIADPTFDSSPPHGLGHWLRVLPTFVT